MSETRDMYQVFCDVWGFMKQYHNCKTDEEFDAMNKAQQQIQQRYKTEFCAELLLACVNEIDRRDKADQ